MNALNLQNGQRHNAEPGAQPITYRFGPFMLDSGRRMLLSGLGSRPLPEKAFHILALLLEANGTVVSKETFLSRVWPEGDVSEANLTQHIFLLRQVLGETAGQNDYIVTVAGKGYRFAKSVESKLGLSMKGSCERCLSALRPQGDAMICTYECTFCPGCAREMQRICPNCGGELVPRPRRKAQR